MSSETSTNYTKAVEMGRRVGLPRHFARRIFYFALSTALNRGSAVDMVQVACAIKYAGDNKHLIKQEYR